MGVGQVALNVSKEDLVVQGVSDTCPASLAGFRVWVSSLFLSYFFAKHFGWGLPARALAGCVIEVVASLFDVMIGHPSDVAFSRKPTSGAAVGIRNSPFLPRTARQGIAQRCPERGDQGSQSQVCVPI